MTASQTEGAALFNLMTANAEIYPRLDDAPPRPTLLAVAPVPPWPATDGMSLRVSSLLKQLALRWRIVLICPAGGQSAVANGVQLAAQIHFPRVAQWMYVPAQYDIEPVVKTVAEAVREHKPVAALLWGGLEYLRDHIREMPPIITDRVDCMTLAAWRNLSLGRSREAFLSSVGHFAYVVKYEFNMRRASRATVVVGESDAKVLRDLLRVRNVRVIPNGVDVCDSAAIERSSKPTVMFTGVMSFQPNVEAVTFFAKEIWPAIRQRLPEAVFQIVGRSPAPEVIALGQMPGVEIQADVESVQAVLARAWLAIAPMRTGSGIKNKVLEAWSVCTPAVMTPIATNGLRGAPSELLLTAEGAEMSDLVVELLLDGERRAKLGLLARSTALKIFSWQRAAASFDALLAQVVAEAGAGVASATTA